MTDKNRALLLGIITIVCWGSLATFGKLTSNLPPFFVLGVSFLFGALPGLLRPREMIQNWKVFFWGAGGYFLYHFFLFSAFRIAPAVEANLINYMWPVLMVMISPLFFRDEKLRWYHILGACLAVIGCVNLVLGKGGELDLQYLEGYALAAGAAITWPLYSIGKKKMPSSSVWAISGFCLGAGLLCLLTHMLMENFVTPSAGDWVKIVCMGLGPFGVAFYCWDVAMAKGDTRAIGALAYLTPVLSTLGLLIFGGETLTPRTLTAMILIIGGASLGILDFLPKRHSPA